MDTTEFSVLLSFSEEILNFFNKRLNEGGENVGEKEQRGGE